MVNLKNLRGLVIKMSGGHFNYSDRNLLTDMYGWNTESAKATTNPYNDYLVSQLMYDLLKLTHSLDWYESGDTCEGDYTKDLADFKEKWLGESYSTVLKEIINGKIFELRDELIKMIDRK